MGTVGITPTIKALNGSEDHILSFMTLGKKLTLVDSESFESTTPEETEDTEDAN